MNNITELLNLKYLDSFKKKLKSAPKERKIQFIPSTGTFLNKDRQARKSLCKSLGITIKQLRKRRILRDYTFRNDTYFFTGRL